MNGKNNTQCVISDSLLHPAAEYCNTFSAASSGKGSSGWYLPAAGELYSMSFSYGTINLGLQKLSKTQISSNYYWSSSKNTSYYYGTYDYDAWAIRPSDGDAKADHKSYSKPVRCILAL